MTMSTKATLLKQIFSFKSLRLMDKKDSSSTNKTCFSDSEINDENSTLRNNRNIKIRSKSETGLNTFVMKDCGDKIDAIKASYDCSHTKKAINEIKASNDSIQFKNTEEILHSVHQESVKSNDYRKIPECTVENDRNVPVSSDISSPYRILEVDGTINENILGEPRCLTIKKQNMDINPFLMDDSLTFEPDFEDDSGITEKPVTKVKKNNRKEGDIISDMFLDDDDEVSQNKKNSLTADKEEGELSPEGPLVLSDAIATNEMNLNKKWSSEFFIQINECLHSLNEKCKEFYLSSTPDSSITHLQRTLDNVDSLKRKLSFLLKTKRIEIERNKKKNKLKKQSDSKHDSKSDHEQNDNQSKIENLFDSANMAGASSYAKNVRRLYENMILDKRTASDRDDSYSSRKDDRRSDSKSRYSHRRQSSSRDRPTQADLLSRKRISILEKLGTKQEIARIQSLFKRQMNLITRHVIQKKETEKGTKLNKEDCDINKKLPSSQKRVDENTNKTDKLVLSNLKTLEDMEAFMESLRRKSSDNTLTAEYLEKERKKKLLKFTSKKDKIISQNISQNLLKTTTTKSITKDIDISERFVRKEKSQQSLPSIKENDEYQKPKQGEKQKIECKTNNDVPAITHLTSESDHNEPRKSNLNISNSGIQSKFKTNRTADQTETETVPKEKDYQKDKRIIQNSSQAVKQMNNLDKKTNESVDVKDDSFKTKKYCISVLNSQENHERDTHKGVKRKIDCTESHLNDIENKERRKREKKEKEDILVLSRSSGEEDEDMVVNQFRKYLSQKELSEKNARDSFVKDLLSKKIVIFDDNNFAGNNQFCIKLIGNEVYLKKVSNKRKRKHSRKHLKNMSSKSSKRSVTNSPSHKETKEHIESNINTKNEKTTLEEMENFLEGLRSKKKVENHGDADLNATNPHDRELKFLARIRAKRKAKLMAHMSDGLSSSEKEAKFLKALEKRSQELSDSSDIEIKKQELIEKIRAETDAIVLTEKAGAKYNDDDPLSDVKEFLNMLKEAEKVSDENSKQFCVSFSLKRSDVKKLENLATGKTSSLSEESQKLLNSVRFKMKSKRAPISNVSALMQKPEV